MGDGDWRDVPAADPAWGHGTVADHRGHLIHYTRAGRGRPVVCLHGWPGFWYDYRRLRPLLHDDADVIAIDLLGFGDSARPDVGVAEYGRAAQAALVRTVLQALDLPPAVVVGYDVGSAVAVQLARDAPTRVTALVLGNPMHPAAGARALRPEHRGEFWYQDFHRLALSSDLVDGRPEQVGRYLGHFYEHWAARHEVIRPAEVREVVEVYSRPGAFAAGLNWYRSGSGTIASAEAALHTGPPPPVDVPATVLWGAADPLFPPSFAEGLESTLPRAELTVLAGVGHFTPVEAAEQFALAVHRLL